MLESSTSCWGWGSRSTSSCVRAAQRGTAALHSSWWAEQDRRASPKHLTKHFHIPLPTHRHSERDGDNTCPTAWWKQQSRLRSGWQMTEAQDFVALPFLFLTNSFPCLPPSDAHSSRSAPLIWKPKAPSRWNKLFPWQCQGGDLIYFGDFSIQFHTQWLS